VFPDLQIEKPLPMNTDVDVVLPVNAPASIAFQCGMGMYRGSVVAR
jgi:plastocyanin domain-containing protein